MAYAVVIGGILGHVMWYGAIGRIGVTRTLLYQFFIPIWAVLFNHLFLGEEVSLQQILGGALILFGVYRALRV
jgi:drug/metabolite transporter (DMT)-like permease